MTPIPERVEVKPWPIEGQDISLAFERYQLLIRLARLVDERKRIRLFGEGQFHFGEVHLSTVSGLMLPQEIDLERLILPTEKDLGGTRDIYHQVGLEYSPWAAGVKVYCLDRLGIVHDEDYLRFHLNKSKYSSVQIESGTNRRFLEPARRILGALMVLPREDLGRVGKRGIGVASKGEEGTGVVGDVEMLALPGHFFKENGLQFPTEGSFGSDKETLFLVDKTHLTEVALRGRKNLHPIIVIEQGAK